MASYFTLPQAALPQAITVQTPTTPAARYQSSFLLRSISRATLCGWAWLDTPHALYLTWVCLVTACVVPVQNGAHRLAL